MGISDSPSWIFIHEPLFQLSPPWIFILGHFEIITTIDQTSMGIWRLYHHHGFSSLGISGLSPPWIFIHGHFRLSPPWIFILGLSDYHHHRFSIYGHFSYFTTMDFHPWAFRDFHHHGFSSLGISRLSPPWIFICGHLRLSPPWIFVLGLLRFSPP